MPLLKGLDKLPFSSVRYQIMDAGCDYGAIYQQVYRVSHQSLLTIRKTKVSLLALTNISLRLVLENILTSMIALMPSMKR